MAKATKGAAPKKAAVKKTAAKKAAGSKPKRKRNKPKNPEALPGECNTAEQAAGADGFPSQVVAYDGE